MIYLSLYNKLYIKIDTDDDKILDIIKREFSYYVENYYFMPRYKSGVWDGKIHLFDFKKRLLPFGLLFDLIKLLKNRKCEIKASDEVKSLFGNKQNIEPTYDLKFEPRYYQDELIKECLRHKKGLFISPTASGKSYTISCLINELVKNNLIKKSLIIVPTTSLVFQFYDDMIEYGINEDRIGKFYADEKDWNKPILISTWQSLAHNNEKLRKTEVKNLKKELKKKSITEEEKEKAQNRYNTITSQEYMRRIKEFMDYKYDLMESIDCVIVDECQGLKSNELLNLMRNVKNAEWRFGCTGTIPTSKIDINNIKSFIGPILKRYTVRELTDAGYLNECVIDIHNLYYENKITGNLNEIKDEIFSKSFRKSVVYNILNSIGDENALVLVGRIEKEGIILEDYLKKRFPDKQIKFIHGKIKPKEREKWRQKCINEDNIILIAVYQLFQQGINIPNLSYVIFGSSYKAKIRTLQSIGRSLRISKGKKKSHIIDIVDHSNKYLPKHAKERMSYYVDEEFEINKSDIYESEWNDSCLWD